jgi:hypothetical protein
MILKRWLTYGFILILIVLSACGTATPTETNNLEDTPTSQAQSTTITESEPDISPDGTACSSPTLGITLTIPGPAWNCEPVNESWLKLTSPLFEVNISNLGRGPFCFPDMDSSCQSTAFFSNEVVDLQLYSSGGQAREIFGLAEFPDSEASVWVAITWQDMAIYALSEADLSEIIQLIATLELLHS